MKKEFVILGGLLLALWLLRNKDKYGKKHYTVQPAELGIPLYTNTKAEPVLIEIYNTDDQYSVFIKEEKLGIFIEYEVKAGKTAQMILNANESFYATYDLNYPFPDFYFVVTYKE